MKICTHPNCSNPVFSHGICKFHYKWKPKIKKVILPKNTGQLALFDQIWNTRPHVSELSGGPLDKYYNTPFFIWLFAHVLDKKNYPLFIIEEENIMLMSPEEHRLLDHGDSDHREAYNEDHKYTANWDLFFQKKGYLKNKYRERLHQLDAKGYE